MGDDTIFKKVLVALDGTPQSNVALPFGRVLGLACIALARLTRAALVLVRAVSPPERFWFDPLLATTLGARPPNG
jgi:hypothetical protein